MIAHITKWRVLPSVTNPSYLRYVNVVVLFSFVVLSSLSVGLLRVAYASANAMDGIEIPWNKVETEIQQETGQVVEIGLVPYDGSAVQFDLAVVGIDGEGFR